MNKTVLEALMRLFAIIADVSKKGISISARDIVRSYLKRQFTQLLVDEYLKIFDKYLNYYSRNLNEVSDEVDMKVESFKSVKILVISQQINEELEQEQKVIVLIELFEFAKENYDLSERELSFIKTVSNCFNIPDGDFNNIKSFVTDKHRQIPEQDKVLIIDDNHEFDNKDIKHLYNATLEGKIIVLHISSTNTFIFRYLGRSTLYLNGHNIKVNRSYFLAPGAVIKSSKVLPIYYTSVSNTFIQDSIHARVILKADNIRYKFRNSDDGVHTFSMTAESGQLICILGGSGVGKSTLLNVLNGNLPLTEGKISINGYDIHDEQTQLEGVIGYVPQDDLLIEELSVYQNLFFNAKICFTKFRNKDIEKIVDKALKDFDLEEARELIVGNPLNKYISGGQRKRLNIALELMREPSILFVDEPTSGLSSMDSEKVMNLLKRQTIKGKLVIVNVHQPSSDIYKLFDRVLVMDKGGRIIYNGNPLEAIVYFKTMSNHVDSTESECYSCGNVNSEQVLRIVEARMVNEYGKLTRIRKVSPQEWYEMYQNNIEKEVRKTFVETEEKEKLPRTHFKIPKRAKQFKLFAWRDILSKWSNKQYLLISFLEGPLLAIILGYFTKYTIGTQGDARMYVFSENKNLPAYIFMTVIVSLFLGLMISAEELIKDRRILKREKFLHLSRSSYLNSKIMILFGISAIQALSYVLIGNAILENSAMNWRYWIVFFTAACTSNLIGLNISSALNSVVTIYILIPFILVPQILLSGVIVKFSDLHRNIASPVYVPVTGDLMLSRWAYEALAVAQFKDNRYQRFFFKSEQKMSENLYLYGYLVPRLQSKVDGCERMLTTQNKGVEFVQDVTIIRNEMELLSEKFLDAIPIPFLGTITTEKFDPIQAQNLRKTLANLKIYFNKEYVDAAVQKDSLVKMFKRIYGENAVVQFKQKYHNKYLADMMTNKLEVDKILEFDDRLIQMTDLVYKMPDFQNGRAHYYAPFKNIKGVKIDTFWFNVMALWLFTGFFYILLYFDVLRKIVNYYDVVLIIRRNVKLKWIESRNFMFAIQNKKHQHSQNNKTEEI